MSESNDERVRLLCLETTLKGLEDLSKLLQVTIPHSWQEEEGYLVHVVHTQCGNKMYRKTGYFQENLFSWLPIVIMDTRNFAYLIFMIA